MIRSLVTTSLVMLFGGTALATGFAPPSTEGPVPVTVLLDVLDLDNVDSAQQVFTANVYLEYSWSDPRLVHDGSGPIFKGMNEIWQPDLQVLNQQKLWSTFPERFEAFPDGRVRYRQRVWGDFSQPLDLRDYPADHQALTIQLVATTSMLTLIAFRFAVDANLPKISYLTRLDAFIMASTVLIFLGLFEVIATSRLAKTGRLAQAVACDRWSRLVFPLGFVAVTVWSLAA